MNMLVLIVFVVGFYMFGYNVRTHCETSMMKTYPKYHVYARERLETCKFQIVKQGMYQ